MLSLFVFFTSFVTTFAGYAGSYSGNYVDGDGQQYSYTGTSDYPNVPGFPFPDFPKFDFNFLSSYFDTLQKYHQQLASNGNAYSYSFTSNTANSKTFAKSSIIYDQTNGIQQQVQKASVNGYPGNGGGYSYSGTTGNGGSYGGGFGGSYGSGGFDNSFGSGYVPSSGSGYVPSAGSGYVPSSGSGYVPGSGSGVAYASGNIGQHGGQQSAGVFPENPNSPNIQTRFFGSPNSGGGGGSYGVFTSSQSSSSNVNGKPTSFHRASTTINDNGKVSTYTVHNP